MKFKTLFFIISLLLTCQLLSGQKQNPVPGNQDEVYFSFQIQSKGEIKEISKVISVANVKNNTVWAFANMSQFLRFSKMGYNITLLPDPANVSGAIMKDHITLSPMTTWDYYPTYGAYENLMSQFQSQYPSICEVKTIATLTSGRKLIVAKISDNVATDETEPEFLYTSSIHGNETTGYVLMLHLIDYLTSNYGINTEVTDLVNNMEIYICPLANPDGTYHGGDNSVSGATRGNANGVDMNRNYPDPQNGDHPDGNAWQAETVAFMNFATAHHFVAAANFHGGSEVVNYPWDTWSTLSADDNWWQYVSNEYADTAQYHAIHLGKPSYLTSVSSTGITNGYAWYEVNGGRQDYMNYFQHCREVTIEISDTMIIPASRLQAYWEYNWRSFILWMKEARYGIQGIITDQVTGYPVAAKVYISGHDNNNAEVYSSANLGDYQRLIKAGTYALTISATNYLTKTITGVTVTDHALTPLNIQLTPITPSVITYSASSVTGASATLNGMVNPNGYSTTYHFEWGTTTSYGTSTTTTSAGSGTTSLMVNSGITGLSTATLYHCRIVATNTNGTTNGNDITFSYGIANITTTAATNITNSTATSGGTVISDGGVPVTARGVCWSTSANPIVSGSHTTDGAGTGSFTSSLTGLSATTLYHIRAYATNSTGTYYGSDLQFTTLSDLPALSTTTPSSVTSTSAISGGNVTYSGTSAVTARGVCWSTTSNPTISNSHTTDGSGTGIFLSSITGLSGNTTYHVRAYATNSSGTSYGSDLSFTTLCGFISVFPWTEGFENAGSIPGCWTQEQVNNSGINWTFITGSGNSHPSSTHGGTYNACLKDNNATDNKTRLITPPLNLSSLGNPTLTFWHTQAIWGSDQDYLYVYYRTSSSGTWTLLATYTANLTAWTQVTLSLPYASSEYYIDFEGDARYGYGVCVDDVSVTGNSLSLTPANQSVSAASGSTSFAVTSNASWTASSNQSWCTVTSSGSGNGTISATYSANTTASSRVATITVTVAGLSQVATVTQAAGTKTLNLSFFLEGYYLESGMMQAAMDDAGFHWGSTITDKVTVELHDGSNYSTILYTAANVPLNTNGTASVTIPASYSSSYYLTIITRNHILTTTTSPVSFATTSISYLFDTPGKAYGDNMEIMTDGVYTLHAGDSTQDGLVDSSDLAAIANLAAYATTGYLAEDMNGDGLIDSSDLSVTGNSAAFAIGSVTPN
jgi:hypothetical protein